MHFSQYNKNYSDSQHSDDLNIEAKVTLVKNNMKNTVLSLPLLCLACNHVEKPNNFHLSVEAARGQRGFITEAAGSAQNWQSLYARHWCRWTETWVKWEFRTQRVKYPGFSVRHVNIIFWMLWQACSSLTEEFQRAGVSGLTGSSEDRLCTRAYLHSLLRAVLNRNDRALSLLDFFFFF